MMRIAEIATTKPIKPLTADEQKLKQLSAGAERAKQAVKQERQRQKVQKAQTALVKARQTISPS